MDWGQLFFPFMMAVITNSIMIIAIYFLRKIPYFANLFGVWFMVVLYLFCILRVFLPLELPGIQIILRDSVVYNYFIESMAQRSDDAMIAPNIVPYIILCVWLIGTIVLLSLSLYTQRSKTIYYLANYDFTTDEERSLFNRIACEILGENHKAVVKKTDAAEKIMVIGYRRQLVLLPAGEYAPDELEMIFRHECTHIRNRDLWIKLLVHIYCCIFWWNPFSYLLKLDLSYTLEMKCDLIAVRELSDEKVKLYFDALTKRRGQEKKDQKNGRLRRWLSRLRRDPFYLNAEFADRQKAKELRKRISAIAADPPKKVRQAAVNTLVALFFVVIFVASYIFIWQPFYGPDVADEDYELFGNEFVVNESTCYLVLRGDDTYALYHDGNMVEIVAKEDVEEGLYREYPILDN